MKNFIFVVLALGLACPASLCQTKATSKTPISKKPIIGFLKTEDYPYYLLVRRTSVTTSKTEQQTHYTLKNNRRYGGKDEEYRAGNSVIMDIRTGKEVAWWPDEGENYWLKSEGMLVNKTALGIDRLMTFDTTGLFRYEAKLSTNFRNSAIGNQFVTLSTDWKRGVFVYNNDLWLMSFDLTTGKLSNPVQATFNGAMPQGKIFFKDDHVLTSYDPISKNSSCIVNLASGKFTPFSGFWNERNNYITDQFYVEGTEEGWWSMLNQIFVPASSKKFLAFWTNRAQTSSLIIKKGAGQLYSSISEPIHFYYQRSENDTLKMDTPHMTGAYGFSFAQDYSPYFTGSHNLQTEFSPDSSRLLIVNSNDNEGVVVLDFTTLKESQYPIPTEENNPVTWTDSTHLFFNARPGMEVGGQAISSSNQGTYIFDILTQKATRISAYLTNPLRPGYFNPGLSVWTFEGSNYTVFEANNLIFRCRPDGNELTPLIQFPGLYKIGGAFLSPHSELN